MSTHMCRTCPRLVDSICSCPPMSAVTSIQFGRYWYLASWYPHDTTVVPCPYHMTYHYGTICRTIFVPYVVPFSYHISYHFRTIYRTIVASCPQTIPFPYHFVPSYPQTVPFSYHFPRTYHFRTSYLQNLHRRPGCLLMTS